MESPRTDSFFVGEWLVRPALHRLERGGEVAALEPRVMRVLERLAAAPGEVVTREALLDDVWAGVVVEEDALTRAVSDLRRTFADDARTPRYVETIRKRGYRLVAPVLPAPPAGDGQSGGTGAPHLAAPATPAPVPPDVGSPVARRPRARLVVALSLVAAVGVGLVAGVAGGGAWMRRHLSRPVPVATPLTSTTGQETHPALAPDGGRVAFIRREEGAVPALYVKAVGSETLLRLTDSTAPSGHPAWRPDGAEIAYVRGDSAGEAVYGVPALGGPARRLTPHAANVTGIAWAPDGLSLVYGVADEAGQPARLARLDLATRRRTVLTHPPATSLGDAYPAVSPDGRRVAFVRATQGGLHDVYVLGPHGEERRLTTGGLGARGLAWRPDGHRIVASLYRNGTFGLWDLDSETGAMRWLPLRGERIYYPTVAAGRLAYEELTYDKDVWRLAVGPDGRGRGETRLLTSTRWECEAYYSPDGRRVVFTSARSGPLELWLADADGGNAVQLTRFDGAFVGNPRWSPDGRSVAFYANPDGRAAAYVVDVESGALRRLTPGTSDDWVSGWTRDGRAVLMGSNRSGRWEVWRVPVDGGAARPLTRGGGLAAAEGADGALYVTRPGHVGLWRLAGPGAAPTLAIPDLQPDDWGNWWLQGAVVFYLRREEGRTSVVRHDLTTGASVEVAPVERVASPSLSASPDGRAVLYARVERAESDLVLVEEGAR